MQRILPVGELRVGAVGGEEVLGQVVGADAHEVDDTAQLIGDQDRRGDLHHDADARLRRVRHLRPRLLDERTNALRVGDVGDHRRHDRNGAAHGSRGEKDRAELRREQGRVLVREPDGTHAEERVRLVRDRNVGQRLVAADVGQAHDDRCVPRRAEHLLVGRGLLLDRRRRSTPREGELGPEEADALGTGGERRLGLGRLGDVRGADDTMPVGRGERARGEGRVLLASPRRVARRTFQAGTGAGVRVEDGEARVAVDGELVRLRRAGHEIGDPDHGGDAQRAGQDGRVRGARAALERDAREVRAVELDGDRRRQVFGDRDRATLEARRRGSGEMAGDARRHVTDIGRARREHLVVQGLEHARRLVARRRDRRHRGHAGGLRIRS